MNIYTFLFTPLIPIPPMSFSDLAAKRSARLKQQQHQQQQRDKIDDVTDDIASDKKATDDNPINPIIRPISILNDDIQVEQTSTKGRGVFARRDIKRGGSSADHCSLLTAQILQVPPSYPPKRQ